ncbi:MAG: ribosomal RNA small subunit methyltransferase A [Thermomicrobiales bacterium]
MSSVRSSSTPSNREPSKRMALSQNFLHSRTLVRTLVARFGIGPDDLVIEIGPGRGIVTEALAGASRHVLAIEKDPAHAAAVERQLAKRGTANVTVFAADFLDFPLPATPYRVFANIPFGITAAIVGKLTTGTAPPVSAHLVVQQEAADRFMGLTAVTLQAATLHPWFTLAIEHRFQRRDFTPIPQVDCVLLRIDLRPDPLIPSDGRHRDHYEAMVAALFSAWKPSVEAALTPVIGPEATKALRRSLGAQGISLANRPSRFPLAGWVALYLDLAKTPHAPWWPAFHDAAARLRERQETLEKRTRTPAARPARPPRR